MGLLFAVLSNWLGNGVALNGVKFDVRDGDLPLAMCVLPIDDELCALMLKFEFELLNLTMAAEGCVVGEKWLSA